jgi:hypothetical protein
MKQTQLMTYVVKHCSSKTWSIRTDTHKIQIKFWSLLTATHLLHLSKLYNTVTEGIQRKCIYCASYILLNIFDVLKSSSFGSRMHFRKHKQVTECEVRWIQQVADNHATQQSVNKLRLCSCYTFLTMCRTITKIFPFSISSKKSLINHLKIIVQLILHKL